MPKKGKFTKNKAGGGAYIPLPRIFLMSDSFSCLSQGAVKLFFDLMAQYNGFNNGALSIAWSLMNKRGWTSRSHLYRCKDELETNGFIILSRSGGKNKSSLYAITLYIVDECPGKNLTISPTKTPPGGWLKGIPFS